MDLGLGVYDAPGAADGKGMERKGFGPVVDSDPSALEGKFQDGDEEDEEDEDEDDDDEETSDSSSSDFSDDDDDDKDNLKTTAE
jgi:hypothetical protein